MHLTEGHEGVLVGDVVAKIKREDVILTLVQAEGLGVGSCESQELNRKHVLFVENVKF